VPKELELWQFIAERLRRDECVMLLVVAESSGSSPGRAGYKMAVGADGELCGSIGGGVMEVQLVEQAKVKCKKAKGKSGSDVVDQVHRQDVANSSGMICSGKQTVIFKRLEPVALPVVDTLLWSLATENVNWLELSSVGMAVMPLEGGTYSASPHFERDAETFVYRERIVAPYTLYIIGGGHCALALSELMSRMDFYISIFDDRPELNTIEKNDFADEIMIIDGYDKIADHVHSGDNTYVVVMTLGYASDEVVIRSLFDSDFKYFGVLGSKAKMATLMKKLRDEGYDAERLNRIRTPIGIPINSRTPEEIAVSIAAEIISVKNAD
jgi:xanthine dehydrogenase accessory factor